MVNSNSDGKTGDLTLLSDGSSPNNSTGNTPDSAEALDSSESSSIDRRLVKDVKIRRSGEFILIIIIIQELSFHFQDMLLLINAAHAFSCQQIQLSLMF